MAEREPERLRLLVQRFVRGFGLLDGSRTPCGQPMSTTHAHLLMLLLREARGAHLSRLAGLLAIDKSNVTRTIRELSARGHVRLEPDPADARLKRARLTPKGARLARSVDASSRRRFEALFAGLAPRERRHVLAGFAAINRALQREAER
jgi:DNA-binding MarR family transcriptional regulator